MTRGLPGDWRSSPGGWRVTGSEGRLTLIGIVSGPRTGSEISGGRTDHMVIVALTCSEINPAVPGHLGKKGHPFMPPIH
jgi:hypothetical protein